MKDRLAWRKAFLGGQAVHTVATLHAAWKFLADVSAVTFGAHVDEPSLTKLLGQYLESTKQQARLTGQWSYEVPQSKLETGPDGGLRRVKCKRTDIKYFSDRSLPALHLVFEFKYLDHRSAPRKKYMGEDGMLRFITGEYSIGDPMAIMVGIMKFHWDDCVPPLLRLLNSADAKSSLYMETTKGTQVRTPSEFFSQADFDTEHLRPTDKAPEHGTIVISHLFCGFPNPARAKTARERREALTSALDD